MTRWLLVVLATVFVFCGCQSAPTFGQSAGAAPQPQSTGFFGSVVQAVTSLWSGSPAALSVQAQVPASMQPRVAQPSPLASADVPGGLAALQTQFNALQSRLDAVQTQTGKDVSGGLDALHARLDVLQARLDAVQARTSKLDRRSGQSRSLVLGLVVLNGAVVLVVLLVALGVIGRPPLFTDPEKARVLALRAVGKRQAGLTAALAELRTFAAQTTADREQFAALLSAATDELRKLEAETAAIAGPAHT
jgi:septal ring factor EnvC (AmiA/AmiB activator)